MALLWSLLGVGNLASAADEAKDGTTYTSREAADEDFQFQGEYRGWQRPQASSRSSQSVAIQVIAAGEGKFEAVKYYGGLPGGGWRTPNKYPLSGTRVANLVRLTGGQYAAEIEGTKLRLFDADGNVVGVLDRVERLSPTMGAQAPRGAIVLFDGTNSDRWKGGKINPEGWLQPGTETVESFSEFRLHGEFMLPYKPLARGQNRGNSGFYLLGRYEVQVLDSFGLEGIENECGSLYKTKRPDMNLCLPPLQWQTYDIDFTNARFDASGQKTSNMRVTIWHNGVRIHDSASIPNKTGAGQAEGPDPRAIKIQDHANPVVYRNIWLVDKTQPGGDAVPWLDLPLTGEPLPVGW